MNRIVRAHFPVEKLPQELREGLEPNARVTITIEAEAPPEHVMTLEEMFAFRCGAFSSIEEAVQHIPGLRDEWDR